MYLDERSHRLPSRGNTGASGSYAIEVEATMVADDEKQNDAIDSRLQGLWHVRQHDRSFGQESLWRVSRKPNSGQSSKDKMQGKHLYW